MAQPIKAKSWLYEPVCLQCFHELPKVRLEAIAGVRLTLRIDYDLDAFAFSLTQLLPK